MYMRGFWCIHILSGVYELILCGAGELGYLTSFPSCCLITPRIDALVSTIILKDLSMGRPIDNTHAFIRVMLRRNYLVHGHR